MGMEFCFTRYLTCQCQLSSQVKSVEYMLENSQLKLCSGFSWSASLHKFNHHTSLFFADGKHCPHMTSGRIGIAAPENISRQKPDRVNYRNRI